MDPSALQATARAQMGIALFAGMLVVVALAIGKRPGAPRWIVGVPVLLVVAVAGGILWSRHALRAAFAAMMATPAADKATVLADGVSRALRGMGVAVAACVVTTLALAFAAMQQMRRKRLQRGQ